MKNDAKLKGKDLINVGIYAAIYCVIMKMCIRDSPCVLL